MGPHPAMLDLGRGDEQGMSCHTFAAVPLDGRHSCSGDSCVVDVVRIEDDVITPLDTPSVADASVGFGLSGTHTAGVSAEERTVFFGLAGTPRRHLVLAILLI